MKFLKNTFTRVKRIVTHTWEHDPLRRRPLSGLAHQESRIRSKHNRRQWIGMLGTR